MGEDIAKLALTVPKDARLLSARIVPGQHLPITQGYLLVSSHASHSVRALAKNVNPLSNTTF
jgi:hypothetical protein